MQPHAARMTRIRADEKDRQRRAQREASISSAAQLDDTHPDASQEAVRNAREMFARAMQDARARDSAAVVAACEGNGRILPTAGGRK